MRHRVAGLKLGRDTEHRLAMRRNMAVALFTHGQITTTVPKAKSVRPFVEKLITAARRGDLAARRRVIKAIGDPILVDRDLKASDRRELAADGYRVNKYHELKDGPRVVKKLFDEIAPRYADRAGGYTRIVRLGKHRIGDGSDLCVLQLVGDEEGPQVSGDYSRRRDKANRRMEFAAGKRKQRTKGAEAATATEQAPPQEEAAAEPETEATEATEAETSGEDQAGEASSKD
ncbi:MAG: 50S ribosomal protein L17 [Phycisphaeraceae bacterium]|nr:50S ribosomal protein L17 [Phycisphaeraceae bacterium]